MSYEYLSFNKSGQWELHKATNSRTGDDASPKDAEKLGNEPFNVYRGKAMTGELHEDHGQKGTLHDTSGGVRPKAQHVNWKNVGRPAHPTDSMYNERHPGVGD